MKAKGCQNHHNSQRQTGSKPNLSHLGQSLQDGTRSHGGQRPCWPCLSCLPSFPGSGLRGLRGVSQWQPGHSVLALPPGKADTCLWRGPVLLLSEPDILSIEPRPMEALLGTPSARGLWSSLLSRQGWQGTIALSNLFSKRKGIQRTFLSGVESEVLGMDKRWALSVQSRSTIHFSFLGTWIR